MDGVMDQPVTDDRLMDDAMLWVEDVEPMIRTVTISFQNQVFMEGENVILKMPLECRDVRLVSFSTAELAPG